MLVEGLLEEMNKARADSAVTGRAYATLIASELRDLLDLAPTAGHRRQLEDLWAEVTRSLAHPWTAAKLARQAGVSTTHLHRLMVQYYGTNPARHLRNLRMQRAEELLLQTDATLDVIAEELGYSTAFAFSRAFKEHRGSSPREYRRHRLL